MNLEDSRIQKFKSEFMQDMNFGERLQFLSRSCCSMWLMYLENQKEFLKNNFYKKYMEMIRQEIRYLAKLHNLPVEEFSYDNQVLLCLLVPDGNSYQMSVILIGTKEKMGNSLPSTRPGMPEALFQGSIEKALKKLPENSEIKIWDWFGEIEITKKL